MSQSPLACVEIGGSGVQTVVFSDGTHRFVDGVEVPRGAVVAVAVPGHIVDGRVAVASTLGWTDIDPAPEPRTSRCGPHSVPTTPRPLGSVSGYCAVGLILDWCSIRVGSGIGGAVVDEGVVTHCNLFGHQPGFGSRRCSCGRIGCLETQACGPGRCSWPPDGAAIEKRGTGDRHRAGSGASRRTGPRRRGWWGGGALSATHRPDRCRAPRARDRRQHPSARGQVGCGMGNARTTSATEQALLRRRSQRRGEPMPVRTSVVGTSTPGHRANVRRDGG